jgi:plasmid stabilization system protein ParE
LRITYTDEAIADILDAISYLTDRSPTAATNLDSAISVCIGRLAHGEFDGTASRLRSGALVQSWPIPPFRIYYQRRPAELLILRVYHQAREPIER